MSKTIYFKWILTNFGSKSVNVEDPAGIYEIFITALYPVFSTGLTMAGLL